MNDKAIAKQVETQNTMMESLDELFAQSESFVVLSDGHTRVDIEVAKFKHLRAISSFIEEFAAGFDATGLLSLIQSVSERQEKAISDGVSPYALGTTDIVKEMAGDASLLVGLISRGLNIFPKYVGLFSSIKEEEVDEMSIEDLSLVVFAIFGRNYHFFTHQALPVIQGCFERLGKVRSKSQKDN